MKLELGRPCSARVALSLTSLLLTLLLTSSCSPTLVQKPGSEASLARVVAVLPVKFDSSIQREKAQLLYELLLVELRNNDFFVVDKALIQEVCGEDSTCPNRRVLVDKYGTKNFIVFGIDSLSRNNFLAGYYNWLSGSLIVEDKDSNSLVTVSHTERDSGGLVFESGQVFQAIASQIRNSSAEGMNLNGEKFVAALVKSLPKGTNEPRFSPSVDLGVTNVSVQKLKPMVVQVCVDAPRGTLAYLNILEQSSRLRETKSGVYCSIYRLENPQQQLKSSTLELRSSYGVSKRTSLASFLPGAL